MVRLRRAAALVVVSGVLLAGCGGEQPSGGGTVPIPEATPADPGGRAEPPGGPVGSPDTEEGAALGDGRHSGFITAVDVQGRTVTVDLMDMLTGDEAREAYITDHPDDPEGPPNDHYIVDQDSAVVTLPVSAGVEVTVVWLGEGGSETEQITFEELPGYLTESLAETDDAPAPFWFTLAGGTVTAIEEQNIP